MKLSVRNVFACNPDQFWDLFWDPAYDAALQTSTEATRETIEDHTEGGVRTVRYRFTPKKALPGAFAKIIGTDRIVYDQINVFDRSKNLITWRVVPAIAQDKVKAEGTFIVKPHAQGSERIAEGEIDVRIPFIGGKVESTIVGEVTKAYEAATNVMNDMIRTRG